MNTAIIREQFGLTQKEISDFFEIPLRTVTNWDNRNCMPEYVFKMIRNICWQAVFTVRRWNNLDIENGSFIAIKFPDDFREVLKMMCG